MSDVKPRRGRKRAAADPQTVLSAGTGVEESAGAIATATVKKEVKEEQEVEETGGRQPDDVRAQEPEPDVERAQEGRPGAAGRS